MAKPFVKWAGGKRKLVPRIMKHVSEYNVYHEPFLGGGALFYALKPKLAHLSDTNERLIRTYCGIRDNVEGVIRILNSYPLDKDFFLYMRSKKIDEECDASVAAWFIYLNKTGFNGLYRVNKKNEFNVPFGDHDCFNVNEDNLRACSIMLKNISLTVEGFEGVLRRARSGDLVYFDPPYLPMSKTSSFVSYTKDGFGLEEHRRLRDTALELVDNNVTVLISNSPHPLILELFESFYIEGLLANRSINSQGNKRGPVKEFLIIGKK